MTRFGPFYVDFARRQLTRDGEPLHLTPKAFDLLTALVDAAPRVVSKAELHARLWPRSVVADATLVGLVKELRRALNDRDAAAPLIRTAHRVGYAFCMPLEACGAPAKQIGRWIVDRERRIPLGDGETSIGRDPSSTVWLNFASVSRRHARIVVRDERAMLEDLGSKNGTTVDDVPLREPHELRDNDRLAFGRIVVVYRCAPSGLPTVTHVERARDASLVRY